MALLCISFCLWATLRFYGGFHCKSSDEFTILKVTSEAATILRYLSLNCLSFFPTLPRLESLYGSFSCGKARSRLSLSLLGSLLVLVLAPIGLALFAVKVTQLSFIIHGSLGYWTLVEYVNFFAFVNNVASLLVLGAGSGHKPAVTM
jgi:hypothetical protein